MSRNYDANLLAFGVLMKDIRGESQTLDQYSEPLEEAANLLSAYGEDEDVVEEAENIYEDILKRETYPEESDVLQDAYWVVHGLTMQDRGPEDIPEPGTDAYENFMNDVLDDAAGLAPGDASTRWGYPVDDIDLEAVEFVLQYVGEMGGAHDGNLEPLKEMKHDLRDRIDTRKEQERYIFDQLEALLESKGGDGDERGTTGGSYAEATGIGELHIESGGDGIPGDFVDTLEDLGYEVVVGDGEIQVGEGTISVEGLPESVTVGASDDLKGILEDLFGDDDGDSDDGEEDYDKTVRMSIDPILDDGAVASPDDPYAPGYSVSITAEAETSREAENYLDEILEDMEEFQVLGYGKDDPETLIDESWEDIKDEFLEYQGGGSATRIAPYLHNFDSAMPFELEEGGDYALRTSIEGDERRLGDVTDSFFIDGVDDEDIEGWTVSVATEPSEDEDGNPRFQAQDLTESSGFTEYVANTVGIGVDRVNNLFGTLNSTAEPGFNVYVHYDGDGDVDEEQYLTNDMDEIVVKWMETDHTVEGDNLPSGIGPDPSGTVQKTAVLDTYDPAAGVLRGEVYDGGDTTAPPADAIEAAVDIRGNGVIRLEDPLPYEVPDGGRWDVGAELHHADGSFGGREWGGFDIDRYSRTDALRDFAGAFTLLNHGGDMPDEEEEEQYGPQWGQKVQEAREKHGGVIGAIDRFFSLDANDVSDALAGDVLHGWLTGGN